MSAFTNLGCDFDDKIELIADGYSFTSEGIENRDLKIYLDLIFLSISEIKRQYY